MPRQMLPLASRLIRVVRARRRCSGMASPPTGAPVTGAPVPAGQAPLHLRKARVTQVSLEANGSICRGMLRHRYGSVGGNEEEQP